MAMTKAQKAAKAAKAAAAAKNPEPAAASASVPTAGIQAPSIDTSKKVAGENQSTVFVVCKMPRGLYLQIHNFISQDRQVMGGGVEKRQVAMRLPDKFRIKPAILPFGAMPNYPIVDGFSITRDVPADLWRKYAEQNAQLELITTGLLRAFDTEADASAYCREYGKLKTGLEPINPNGDERVEASNNPNLSDVEIDTGKAA